ncbi:MAG: hypothetical protein R3B06_06865 [Kofleriaceae bacterium]
MTESVLGFGGIYLGTFVYCIIAGLVPFVVPAELVLIGLAAKLGAAPAALTAIVVLAASGQMVAKIALFVGARGAIDRASGKRKASIDKARARVEAWREKPLAILFASATFGLPPFYVVSLLAGAMKIRLRVFIILGTVGRLLRFAVVVAIPAYLSA